MRDLDDKSLDPNDQVQWTKAVLKETSLFKSDEKLPASSAIFLSPKGIQGLSQENEILEIYFHVVSEHNYLFYGQPNPKLCWNRKASVLVLYPAQGSGA